MNEGIPAVLYCFVWLYISSAGAEPWSLDAMRQSRQPVSSAAVHSPDR